MSLVVQATSTGSMEAERGEASEGTRQGLTGDAVLREYLGAATEDREEGLTTYPYPGKKHW